jgi:acetyltransferase-like isoleucine patch superfamily enzyme
MTARQIFYFILHFFRFDRFVDLVLSLRTKVRLIGYRKYGVQLNFVPQGDFNIMLAGDLAKFEIHHTSHLKSNTFIECSGGVKIGKYFHVGRGLTIFSTKHNFRSANQIPYDEVDAAAPVEIGDYVWIGANVSIVPGVKIGEGAIVGMGSVVTKNVPAGAVVAGNPASRIGQRDMEIYYKLKNEGRVV